MKAQINKREVEYRIEGETGPQQEQVLLAEAIDLTASTAWAAQGYTVAPFLTPAEQTQLRQGLEALVREGKFRQDLFHRVYVFPLVLPPLRERRDDLPALVEHFAAQVCSQNNWKLVKFTPEAVQALQQYSWPGNIRELRNAIERLILLSDGEEVDFRC